MSKVQVNVCTRVNAQTIRREQHNGRDHIVIPSYTLPANVVMNGVLYPAAEIDAHYPKLEGTLAPLGHPAMDGRWISAFSPEGINVGHVGAWNRNVKKSGTRVYSEKWVDVEVANSTEKGRRLLERVAALERGEDVPPIHTSVAVFLEETEAPAGAEYRSVAKIIDFDHDAILLDEVGAATPEQGVGLMVNADNAKTISVNSGALEGESYRDKERRIESAAKTRFAPGEDQYAWVADFTDTQAIIIRNGGVAEVFGYKIESGKVVFDDTGTAVERRESWIAKINQRFKTFFNLPVSGNNLGAEEMPLTADEKTELAQMMAAAAGTAVAPIAERMSTLEANVKATQDAITANSRAAEAEKRATVAEKFGQAVADSLSGNALDELHKKCGTAAALAGNSAQPNTPAGQDFAKAID